MFHRFVVVLAGITVTFAANFALADVTPDRMFGDHMVLQRDMPVPIWGTADAGEKVTVSFRDQKKDATADKDGKWNLKLDALKLGKPGVLTISGNNSVSFKGVLVGDVWVGSGQSNMAGGTRGYARNDTVLAKLVESAPYPNLRLCRGVWKEATAENINGFSALLFSFGQPLQKELDIPVGLIVGAVGGTPSGRWLSEEMLFADPGVQALFDGKGPSKENLKVGDLYARHIEPVVPYAIRGVLWDQGESGTRVNGVDQFTTMGALIKGWRKAWGQDFPFLYVQKNSGGGCAWDYKNDPTTSKANAFVQQPAKPPTAKDGAYRALHIKIMQHPNTAMVTASDLGSGVHPSNKSGYGKRASRVALGFVYGKEVEIYGPVYDSHKVEGNKIRIHYKHVGKGLAVANSDTLQGFAVAGDDGVFHWADAKIEEQTVVVSSSEVAKPVQVQYGWSRNHPWANLFNKDGLPALTFSTPKP